MLFSSEGNDRIALRLHSSVPLRIHNGDAIAEFTLRPDEHAEFVLEWALPGAASPATASDYVSRCFKDKGSGQNDVKMSAKTESIGV